MKYVLVTVDGLRNIEVKSFDSESDARDQMYEELIEKLEDDNWLSNDYEPIWPELDKNVKRKLKNRKDVKDQDDFNVVGNEAWFKIDDDGYEEYDVDWLIHAIE